MPILAVKQTCKSTLMSLLLSNFTREWVVFTGSLFFLFLSSAWGQENCSYSFQAQLIDLHEDSPLVDARIVLLGTDKITSSTEEGRFQIQGLCPGTYKIKFSHPLCDPQTKTIQIPQKKPFVFHLEHHVNTLAEIIVSEESFKKIRKSHVESGLNTNELIRQQGGNLATALSELSGVNKLQTGTGLAKPIIHGMYGSRVGIVMDGVRLQDQEWGADHAPTLDINAADNIKIIKGAGVLRYGGDTPGGIIVLQKNRKAFQDTLINRIGTTLESNGRGGGLFAKSQWSNGLGSYAQFNLTVKRLGDLMTSEDVLSNTGLAEKAFALTWGRNKIQSGWEASYRFYDTQIGILRSAHVGNTGDLARAIASPKPIIIEPFTYSLGVPRQENQHHNGKLSYFKRFHEVSKWELNYNVQWNHRQEFDVRRGELKKRPAIDLSLWTQDLEVFLETRLGQNYKLSGGLSGKIQDNFSDPETGVKRLIPDHNKYQWAAFSSLQYAPDNQWNIDAGFRFEGIHYAAQKYYDEKDWMNRGYAVDFPNIPIVDYGTQLLAAIDLNFLTFSSSLGIGYNWTPTQQLLFNFNHSERAPNPSELFSDGLHHALATIEYGELRLQKEQVNKWILGVDSQQEKFQYAASVYYSDLRNYIIIEPNGFEQTVRGAFPVWQYQSVMGNLAGMDLDLVYSPRPWLQYKLTNSIIRGHDRTRDRPLIDIPPFSLRQQLTWMPLQKGGWEISLKHHYTAQQTRFPDNNFDYNRLVDGALVATRIDISTPPKGFHLWEVNWAFRIQNKARKFWDFRIIVDNLTNTSYRNYLNRLRFYADEMGRNIKLQVNYNF